MQPEVDCAVEEGGGVTSLSTNLAQSQQEANEPGANPSSPALDPIALSSGSVVAAGDSLPRSPAASLYCPCSSDAIDEDGICHGCGGRVEL